MAQNKIISGIAAMGIAAANILNPPTTTGGVGVTTSPTYIILRRIRVVNKTGVAQSASFWLGLTGGSAAGTEVLMTAKVVPANDYIDWYGMLRIDSTQFLTGLATLATSLVVEFEAEIGVSG